MQRIEFVKTSIHNHFGGINADLTRDRLFTDLSFDIEEAKRKIDNAALNGFELITITNHNYLWIKEYNELREYINDKKYNINLLPGIELDIVDNLKAKKKRYLHVVILVSPKLNLHDFLDEVKSYILTNNENSMTIEQLTCLAFKRKCILIPHGNKQGVRGALKNIPLFKDLISIHDFIPIMIEDKTEAKRAYLEQKIKAHLSNEIFEWLENSASVSTLDQETSFSNIKEPTYIWGIASFDSLFYSAIIGDKRVLRETDINEKSKYIKRIKIVNKGGCIKSANLELSHGLNSIIGNSGSGKTLLLNLLKLKLTGENLKNAVSNSSSDYSKLYEDLDVEIYDNNDQVIKIGEVNVFEGENLYRQIVTSFTFDKAKLLKDLDAEPSFLDTHRLIADFNSNLNLYITNCVEVKSKIKLIDSSIVKTLASVDFLRKNEDIANTFDFIIDPRLRTKQINLEEKLSFIENDLRRLSNSFEIIKELIGKYKVNYQDEDIDNLRILIKNAIIEEKFKLKKELLLLNERLLIDSNLSSWVLEYNKNIGDRAKIISESKQIVTNEIENIINNLKISTLLEKDLKVPVLIEDSLKNSVNLKSDLIILDNFVVKNEIYYDDFSTFFNSSIGSAQNKINKSKFSNFRDIPLNLFVKESISMFADVFIDENFISTGIFSFIPDKLFIYDIMLKDLEGNFQKIETLSAGQLSKIYINLMIDSKLRSFENNAIILYDQPDNNLEKEFILNVLGEKLSELKRKYQVIITTHEPLLVVNSDSNNIIKVTNDPISGKNNIRFETLTLYDIGDIEAAIEKIAKLIDGSHFAIMLRNQIYGGISL